MRSADDFANSASRERRLQDERVWWWAKRGAGFFFARGSFHGHPSCLCFSLSLLAPNQHIKEDTHLATHARCNTQVASPLVLPRTPFVFALFRKQHNPHTTTKQPSTPRLSRCSPLLRHHRRCPPSRRCKKPPRLPAAAHESLVRRSD